MIVRKVTKRVYDKYTSNDYDLIYTDNLNPTTNTQLESQYNDMLVGVKNRIINAYEYLGVEPDDNLVNIEVPTIEGLEQALDNLAMLYNKNPLVGLVKDQGFSIESGQITPFVMDPEHGDTVFNKPFTLDCENIKGLGEEDEPEEEDDPSKDKKDEGDIDDPSSENGDEPKNPRKDNPPTDPNKLTYNISYVFDKALCYNPDSNPKTYIKEQCPLEIKNVQILNNNYKFDGWYYDEAFNSKVAESGIPFKCKDITLYAHLVKEGGGESDLGEEPFDDSLPPGANENPDCPELELSWLRIILIVLKIIKILIQVFVTMLNIAKAVAAIAKDAQLCWINPPCLASLISYCLQRVSAIIFQIVGMLLLYLWSLLNFDCISATSVDLVNQINATLAGLSSTFGAIEATAIDFGETKNAWSSAIDHLKEDLNEQVKDLTQRWSDPDQWLGDIGGEWTNFTSQFTDPHKLYSNAVPPEIRSKVENVINSVNSVRDNTTNMVNSYNHMNAVIKGEKPPQDNKGAKTVILP